MNLSLRCGAAALALALATTAQGYQIGPDISGTFYDPAQSGHGYVLEYLDSDAGPLLAVSWFTYADGEPVWLVGVGAVDGDSASVPLSIGNGGDFPPDFVASQATLSDWGTLDLRFDSHKAGQASWSSSLPGFGNGSMPIQRLTQLALAHDRAEGRVAACHSGSWFDPTQPGHGLFVEVIGAPGAQQMVAVWYTYLDGAQRWLTAVGPLQGARAELSVSQPSGADFPPNFRSTDVVEQDWGSLLFEAVDAQSARLTWNSSLPGYGSGSLDLARLSQPAGYECGDLDAEQAARFLTQASFGPDPASVAELQSLGPAGWIEGQLGVEPTLQRPIVEQRIAEAIAIDPRPGPAHAVLRVDRWFASALSAPDQLRGRMAFALSQILVISDNSQLINTPTLVAEYNDILLRGAFGAYRDLLREVTYSPAMGIFLTHLRNQKTDWTLDVSGQLVASAVQPDENYAREVMQLFSIGLNELRLDGTPILQGGAAVPTYTQDLIGQTARVLTGLAFDCSGQAQIGNFTLNRNCGRLDGNARYFSPTVFFSNPQRYAVSGIVTGLIHPDGYRPMKCYPRYADSGRSATSADGYAVLPAPADRKLLLGGVEIAPSPVACHTSTPSSEQQACIDYCEGQIDTLVDTLAAHPNAAPNLARLLIKRFTTSNPSPGYIERVASAFENDGSGQRGNLGAVVRAILLDPEARARPAAEFGKLREPLLKLTALWRALQAQPSESGFVGPFDSNRFFAQRPLGAPSVFNFYEPDYTQPGVLADRGLVGPEFQILNESTTITSSDALWVLLFNGWRVEGSSLRSVTPQNFASLPGSSLDALPQDSQGLVDALDRMLLYGRMPGAMRSRLIALLDGELASAEHRLRALNLIHLIAISPAFAAQL
jgi:uncharacterized protein (DUF1800 family)